jgi:hypothetical protein
VLNEFHRLRITFAGDANLAASWVPFGKSKIRDLLKEQTAFGGGRDQVRRYVPESGVSILARITGQDKFLHIEAVTGCTDRRGFLMSRRAQVNTALYNDGVSERIYEPPRPKPDPSVRTKGYIIPAQLAFSQLARVSASKFSGLMRLAVGCYHARGAEAPFSYDHAVTHGIVKTPTVVNNKPVTLYWIVEISVLGVYAAPIANTGKCCDSWGVSHYMPHPKNPLLPTLSLHTAFVAHRPGVRELVGGSTMADVYGDGSPFFEGSGWAFSASGAEAQSVLADGQSVGGIPYFRTARWKFTFSLVDANLTADLVAVERHKVVLFTRGNTFWFPLDDGRWAASDMALTTLDAETVTNVVGMSEGPVHVFYAGEVEQVTRWAYSTAHQAEVRSTNPNSAGSGHLGHSDDTTESVFGEACGFHDVEHPGGWLSGFVNDAHTNITLGFSSPAFNHIGAAGAYSGRTETVGGGTGVQPPPETNGNHYLLQPPCYFIGGDPPQLITECGSTFTTTTVNQFYTIISKSFSLSQGHSSSVAVFAEDRDALVAVTASNTSESGTQEMGPLGLTFIRETEKIDSGPCPWFGKHEEGRQSWDGTGMDFPPAAPYTSSSRSAAAALMLGERSYSVSLGFSGGSIANDNLGTFLSFNPMTKTTAESNVRAMHGNLYYPDASLTPMLQRDNFVYIFDGPMVVSGGFATPFEPVAFVGKS